MEPRRWLQKLSARRWKWITAETRLLISLVIHNHFSLLDLDLRERTVQHHDSIGTHTLDSKWITAVKILGEEILHRKHVRQAAITERPTMTELRTQKVDTNTNTCLIHTYRFIKTIIDTGHPIPLSDEIAVRWRGMLADELYNNMGWV